MVCSRVRSPASGALQACGWARRKGLGREVVVLLPAPHASRPPSRSRNCRVACGVSANGTASTLPNVTKGSLQTSSQAILTTFTFPAALAGDEVTLSGTDTKCLYGTVLVPTSNGDAYCRTSVFRGPARGLARSARPPLWSAPCGVRDQLFRVMSLYVVDQGPALGQSRFGPGCSVPCSLL